MKAILLLIALTVLLGITRLKKLRKMEMTEFVEKARLLELGKLVYSSEVAEYELFFKAYITDEEKFSIEHLALMEENGIDELEPLDVCYLFGCHKDLVGYIDWKGEENMGEVEALIENQIKEIKIKWSMVKKFRELNFNRDQRDGNYIIDLFKEADKDLALLELQLLFFDLGSDGYAFKVVSSSNFKKIVELSPMGFHGTERLWYDLGKTK